MMETQVAMGLKNNLSGIATWQFFWLGYFMEVKGDLFVWILNAIDFKVIKWVILTLQINNKVTIILIIGCIIRNIFV